MQQEFQENKFMGTDKKYNWICIYFICIEAAFIISTLTVYFADIDRIRSFSKLPPIPFAPLLRLVNGFSFLMLIGSVYYFWKSKKWYGIIALLTIITAIAIGFCFPRL